MNPSRFMLIAGESSGDRLAAELVAALRREGSERQDALRHTPASATLAGRMEFFGGGGDAMREAGVEVREDLVSHAVVGLSGVLSNVLEFRRLFLSLKHLATSRLPEVIVCIDFGGFNLRFLHAIRRHLKSNEGTFNNWNPLLVQFVSPQVWASRPGRAYGMEEDLDLLLSIIPFEKEWYAGRVPELKVEFVGHPLLDRHAKQLERARKLDREQPEDNPLIVLLPGSRRGEIQMHLPIMTEAAQRIRNEMACRFKMVVPSKSLEQQVSAEMKPHDIPVQAGGLGELLPEASLAISKTGTITMELALFGVPAVTLYKTSWFNYLVGKQLVTVQWLSMPNIIADRPVFPEFIQNDATPDAIAREAVSLLKNSERRAQVKQELKRILEQFGGAGAPARAAKAIFESAVNR